MQVRPNAVRAALRAVSALRVGRLSSLLVWFADSHSIGLYSAGRRGYFATLYFGTSPVRIGFYGNRNTYPGS